MPVPRCVNCYLALKHPLPHREVGEASDVMLSILSSWINPTIVSEENHLCQECFVILQNESINFSTGTEIVRAYGHPQVCLPCGKSILRAKTHQVPQNSPERNVIISCIPVHQINRLEKVCLPCWTNVYRSVRRHAQVDQNTPQEVMLEEAAISQEDLDASMSSERSSTESSIPIPPPLPMSQPNVYTGNAEIKMEPPDPAQQSCSICKDTISGFVFVCVQCGARACGACDARGPHAAHYVLRAPSSRPEGELESMLNKLREVLSDLETVMQTDQPGLVPDITKESPEDPDIESVFLQEPEHDVLKTEFKAEEEENPAEDQSLLRDSLSVAKSMSIVEGTSYLAPDDVETTTSVTLTARNPSDLSPNDEEIDSLGNIQRRHNWTHDMNQHLIQSYTLINKTETRKSRVHSRLKQAFSAAFPHMKVTKSELEEQRKRVLRKKLLSDYDLYKIHNELHGNLHRKPNAVLSSSLNLKGVRLELAKVTSGVQKD